MSASYCRDSEGWGPTSDTRIDLTLCFESTILLGLPSILAIFLFANRSHSLFKQPKHAISIDTSTRQHQVIYWLSTTAMLTACAALIARAVQLGQDNSSSPATQFGTLTLLISWVSAMALNHLEHRQDVRSSTYIYAFYVVTLAASAIHFRTMHDLALTAQSQFASFCVFFGALIVGFVIEAWPRNATVRNQDILDQDLPTVYDQSNLVSRLCFHFMQSVISKGYKQPLVDDDVANMMPRRIRTVHSYDLVSQEWDRHVAKCRTKGNKKPSLLWVVLKAGRWSWLPILVFALAASIMEYVQPLLLDVILSFISSYSTDNPSPPVYGIILSIGMFVAALLASLASGQFYQIGTNLGLEFKAGLVSMIYRKSLKLSPNARRETTVGEISNHMSVDAERISQAVTHIPGIVSAPFEICVGMWMLYRQLGPSAFTGLGVVLMIIPIQTLIGKTLNTAKDKKLEAMDNRVRLMNEILSSIKIVKLYAWRWAGREGTDRQDSIGAFLGVYAALVVLYIGLDVSVNLIIFIQAGYRASALMHNNLLQRVLRLPMSFFDTTPVGRIMNRFSSDVDNMDELLPFFVSDFYFFLTTVLGTLIVISFSVPIFLAVIPFLVVLYLIIQTYYIRSARALKRIYSISNGVSTIRALRVSDQFIRNSAAKSDRSSNAYFAYTISNRWMHIRLEFLGSLVVLATALLAVLGRETLGPAMAGLALSYSLNATFGITLLVTSFSELQNQLVSVERIREYSEKNTEGPDVNEGVDDQLPPNWPGQGSIVFKNYSTRYRQGMDLVIKDISFTVAAGEKVGIVGRTGAGKSSLTLALFRIIEAANSHWAIASHNGADSDAEPNGGDTGKTPKDLEKVAVEEDGGSIEVDGVDISTVGLETLRKHLAIIPQDPTLFAGTVRENLDPFDQVGDAELWEALERAHLKEYISTMPGGLSYEVAQNGDNFSVGQRSLICLARALLRKTKILVLDEATAAVDVETDELIQKTIREEFKDRTILTIAHRIKTVMDSDKILVLEKGRVQEYDSPSELLKKGNSLFYSLAQKAGEV